MALKVTSAAAAVLCYLLLLVYGVNAYSPCIAKVIEQFELNLS